MAVSFSIWALFVLFVASAEPSSIPISDGYYWRDYTGDIPYDAISGGLENVGKRTYIGQVLHATRPNLLVGEIRQDSKQIYFEMSGPQTAKDNVKILCTRHPERYHWVKSSIENMRTLNRDYLVVGGYEGLPLFIGRIEDEGDKVVGKINLDYTDKLYTALWIAHNGHERHFFDNFEVLMYNPDAHHKDDNEATKVININIINY